MSHEPHAQQLFHRYLQLLGVSERAPSVDALTELVSAHLRRVPFENISKLHYRRHAYLRTLPGLERFLDGIERFNFGGTCYANNYYLNQLLVHLGYDVKLCGADMNNPDVHIVSMVEVDGHEYLVDAGYAAPFLAPLPRDLGSDHEVVLGRDRYVLRPQDARGRSRVDLYRDGKLKHGYVAKPAGRRIEHFAKVIAHSYSDEATFMNALLLVRFFPNRSIAIHNFTVIESHGTSSQVHSLAHRDELARAIAAHFAIPRVIVVDAVRQLGALQDAWD